MKNITIDIFEKQLKNNRPLNQNDVDEIIQLRRQNYGNDVADRSKSFFGSRLGQRRFYFMAISKRKHEILSVFENDIPSLNTKYVASSGFFNSAIPRLITKSIN